MQERQGRERVLILVKALPHVGDRHGETVCCAGVTPDGKWRRQFPVLFRSLEHEKRFRRWQWVEYDWRLPKTDNRPESRRVQENSIRVLGNIPKKERSSFLNPLVLPSLEVAETRGHTLALVRPAKSRFYWEAKSTEEIEEERYSYESAVRQFSFLASENKALEPSPYRFKFQYEIGDRGPPRHATCDDWETAAMFFRFRNSHGEKEALRKMDVTFNGDYPRKGVVFAMGTHSRHRQTWLLVGVIRLDPVDQLPLI